RDPNLGKVVLYQLSYFRNYMFLPSCLAAVGNASRKRLNRRFGQDCVYQLSYFRNYMFRPSCLAAVGNASRKRLNRRFGQGCALPTELFPQ
uniref:hypothetical protein n=1 Tax=uncultured Rikenella sp. TaxID=368003 RepID=UPI00262A5844